MKLLGEFGMGLFGRIKKLKDSFDAHDTAVIGIHGATSSVSGGSSRIMIRDSAGRAQVGDPNVGSDIANRDYVDSRFAAAGSGTVFRVDTGAGLTGGPIINQGTILLQSGVTSSTGTFNNANVTVDTYGRITGITAGDSSTTIVATAPITKAGTSTITIGILSATTSRNGYMSKEDKAKIDVSPSVTISTGNPSGGVHGDIWFKV